MSVNIEIPKEESLKLLAPEKDHQSVFQPMKLIQQGVLENKEDRKKYRNAPRFVPAGQSTQMIVGATQETDQDILTMSSMLYNQPSMRRVYYSAARAGIVDFFLHQPKNTAAFIKIFFGEKFVFATRTNTRTQRNDQIAFGTSFHRRGEMFLRRIRVE